MIKHFLTISLIFLGFSVQSQNSKKILDYLNKHSLNFNFNSPVFYTSSNLEGIQNLDLTGDTLLYIRESILNQIPTPKYLVNDYSGFLKKSQVDSLESLLEYIGNKYDIQIAVITLFPFMYDNIDSFSLKIFNKWGIGKKETNYGILFTYDFFNRKVRISNGYGIEKIYTDIETNAIIDKIIFPKFKQKKYFEGIYNSVNQITMEVSSKINFFKKIQNN